MRRRTFDALLTTGGLVLAVVLLVAGALLTWGHSFVDSQVHTQLAQQKIMFPAKGDAGLKDPKIKPYIEQYAGQQVVNGQQARAFADHYIAVHLDETANGQTYSEVSGKWIAGGMKDATLAQQRQTLFMGETLRGLLLNAYAFWKVGQIALYGAIAAFVGAGVLLVLSLLGFLHLRRARPEDEVLPKLGAQTPAPVEP